ncbi:transposase [Ktedonobacter racemifer]|uniref:transposase n=1 Tax=Ktedonobacter racemifer TaxID=363277 RepID=UPI0012F7FEEA|nr:transposase [Ktedonobacter racemifer]
MIWGKITWGRKRHALVDTQGNLLAVSVTGAQTSDHQGGIALLEPLTKALPRLQLIWGESHDGGTFLTWVRRNAGLDD